MWTQLIAALSENRPWQVLVGAVMGFLLNMLLEHYKRRLDGTAALSKEILDARLSLYRDLMAFERSAEAIGSARQLAALMDEMGDKEKRREMSETLSAISSLRLRDGLSSLLALEARREKEEKRQSRHHATDPLEEARKEVSTGLVQLQQMATSIRDLLDSKRAIVGQDFAEAADAFFSDRTTHLLKALGYSVEGIEAGGSDTQRSIASMFFKDGEAQQYMRARLKLSKRLDRFIPRRFRIKSVFCSAVAIVMEVPSGQGSDSIVVSGADLSRGKVREIKPKARSL